MRRTTLGEQIYWAKECLSRHTNKNGANNCGCEICRGARAWLDENDPKWRIDE